MSTFKSFAVVGAGELGKTIINELVARNVTVILLRRPESRSTFAAAGVNIVPVDLADVTAVTEALKANAVEVLISTTGIAANTAQVLVAEAAQKARVKLFVPSEFGAPTKGLPPMEGFSKNEYNLGAFAAKAEVTAQIEKLLPVLRIYTNGWSDFIPFQTGLSQTGTFYIVGNGQTTVAFTAIGDVAKFVAYVVTALPLSELAGKEFHIESDRKTMLEVAALYGDKVKVELVDELPASVGPHATLLTFVQKFNYATTVAEGSGSANHLFPGYKWESIKETLGL